MIFLKNNNVNVRFQLNFVIKIKFDLKEIVIYD